MNLLFKQFLSNAIKISPIVLLPIISQNYKSFWWNSSLKRNCIQKRIHIKVQQSNYPCEDRRDTIQLTSIEGFAAAIYDGHGGWQVSQLCSKVLLTTLNRILGQNKGKQQYKSNIDKLITQSITQAFLQVENNYLQKAKIAYQIGFGRAGRAGSCALVCVVHNNKLYCGNAGDSLGIIVQQNNPMNYQRINRFLNADNPDEQQRLKTSFPNQQDIVICKKPNNKSCYVKGRLQPTRSIGDLRLKHKQFNNPKGYSSQYDFQHPLKVYSGNYITAQPQIQVFQLNKKQKWVVLGSDGLWDQLGQQQVAQICKNNPVEKIGQVLIEKCLEKAALDSKLTVQQIRKKGLGKKRNIHDDITIVVLDLQNQIK